jgi:hypothetical protein
VPYLSCNNIEIRCCQKVMFANTRSEHGLEKMCVNGCAASGLVNRSYAAGILLLTGER